MKMTVGVLVLALYAPAAGQGGAPKAGQAAPAKK